MREGEHEKGNRHEDLGRIERGYEARTAEREPGEDLLVESGL